MCGRWEQACLPKPPPLLGIQYLLRQHCVVQEAPALQGGSKAKGRARVVPRIRHWLAQGELLLSDRDQLQGHSRGSQGESWGCCGAVPVWCLQVPSHQPLLG